MSQNKNSKNNKSTKTNSNQTHKRTISLHLKADSILNQS
jgi:hypothetical protein